MPLHVNYEIRWKNYRAFQDTGWIEIRPLTILIGSNNSGKSNIISPLLLLNQTIASRDNVTALVTRGPLVDVGLYKNIIYNHDANRDITLGFRFHTHELRAEIDEIGAYPPGACEITFTYDDELSDIVLNRYSVSDIYKREFLKMTRDKNKKYRMSGVVLNKELSGLERKAIRQSIPTNCLFSSASVLHEFFSSSDRKRSKNSYDFSSAFSMYLQILGYSFEEVRRIFSSLSYIGPLRNQPKRFYEVEGEIPRSVGPHGERMANLLWKRREDLRERLDDWVRRFSFGDYIDVERVSDEIFSIYFEDRATNFRTNIADAGFGASQILPLIVQALAAPEGSLTIAEQPEIHLNPALQCVLAELFAEMVKNEQRVLVETHSEHVLTTIRRLVASGQIDASDVALYFVERKEGVSKIRAISMQSNGHIPSEEWPKGFFQEGLRQSLALAQEQQRTNGGRDGQRHGD